MNNEIFQQFISMNYSMGKVRNLKFVPITRNKTKFRAIYCSNCQKILGRYNTKYYECGKIKEILHSFHSSHVRQGHKIKMGYLIK